MKKLLYLLMSLIFVAASGGNNSASSSSDNLKTGASTGIDGIKITAQSIISQMEMGNYKEGELLVKYKSGLSASSSLQVNNAVGASLIKRYTVMHNLEYVKLPQGLSVKDAIIQYMSDPNVEYAEPNYIRHIASIKPIIPDDTYFGDQWALLNSGNYANGIRGADISAARAWNISVGSPNVVVAVLDTGIDYTHPDLGSNIWRNLGETSCNDGIDNEGNGFIDDCIGWDFTTCAKFNEDGTCEITKSPGNDPMDDNGHGTHVSGIIGAVGDNGSGISGVMWTAQLMPIKVLNGDGEGQDSDIIAGIDYVVSEKNRFGVNAVAINASFGGGEFSKATFEAIQRANNAGILFIAAAGNGGSDGIGDNNDVTPFYPASYNLPNIISVAATDQDDRRVPFSNFGQTTVQVGAPGVYIWSTVPMSLSATGFGILETMEGTSMAAPHVTGLVGLLNSYYYTFTTSQIRTMVLRYVDILPSLDGWISTGGRINAFNSMSSLWAPGNFGGKSTTSKITLKWINRATDAEGYILERSNDGITYSLLQTLPAKAKSYSDKGLTDGTKYYYRLRAFNDIGASPAAEASVVTRLKPPTKLKANAISDSQVMLTWKDNSSSEDGFKIERRSLFGELAEFHVAANVVSFIDSGLEPGKTYSYRVRAFSAVAGDSAYSNRGSIALGTTGGK